ncbi:hypothetical protein RJT34_08684 [Clitoria ternatea]|uniref:Uncharacterized protein n=1 Tax=Clitoria ternatea TaxID=43366 RepID=A0AAN9K625_CLITE
MFRLESWNEPFLFDDARAFCSQSQNIKPQKLQSDMESDDDFHLLPPSPVHYRKLKRLKKATKPAQNSRPSVSPTNFSEPLEDSNGGSGPQPPELQTGLSAKRVLEFDSMAEELDGNVPQESENTNEVVEDLKNDESETKRPDFEVGGNVAEEREQAEDSTIDELETKRLGFELDGNVAEDNKQDGDSKTDEMDRNRRSSDVFPEKKKGKKKRIEDGDGSGSGKKTKESATNKRKAEKERRETLKQLRADSQRLLRETRDAAFKPAPLVQKPISSILDKIRQRKLEILKKTSASFENIDDFVEDKEASDQAEKAELEETTATCPAAATEIGLNTLHIAESNAAAENPSCESIPSPTATGSESDHAFRAPISDTQELFLDSERSDAKDEAVNERSNNPSEEVVAPSMLAMNLQLDAAPPDDDDSSDGEDNDKENINPHLYGSVNLTLPPSTSTDPVKAFVDEEAEEEDDSDNDLQRFKDDEEGEEDDDDDIEELNDMIATGYEEKPTDREKRDQLHQQWLEQQDADGMDNLLQKLNCASKLKETSIEEDEECEETESESDDEADETITPLEGMKTKLKKAKQMIPLMFTDKDDKYISSDEEETKDRLARQSLYYKIEEKSKFFSPAEDDSSRDVFSRIKRVNILPDTKKRRLTTSIFDMPRIGQNINISSTSSFVGRASNHFLPISQKHGSCKVRSFIFGRDDSNSRTSASISDDSSDTMQKESQPPKAVHAKFQRNTQNKYTTSNSASQKSNVSLLEILKRSSHHAEISVQNAEVLPKESVFEAFKLVKKSIRTEARF